MRLLSLSQSQIVSHRTITITIRHSARALLQFFSMRHRACVYSERCTVYWLHVFRDAILECNSALVLYNIQYRCCCTRTKVRIIIGIRYLTLARSTFLYQRKQSCNFSISQRAGTVQYRYKTILMVYTDKYEVYIKVLQMCATDMDMYFHVTDPSCEDTRYSLTFSIQRCKTTYIN